MGDFAIIYGDKILNPIQPIIIDLIKIYFFIEILVQENDRQFFQKFWSKIKIENFIEN